MTSINEYYWLLPHDVTPEDPVEIGLLQEYFYLPILREISPPLSDLGYEPALSDILIPPDSEVLMAEMRRVFRVNVRFTRSLASDTFLRFHFEHHDWHHMASNTDHHTFSIYFDSFRFIDPAIRRLDENWDGRLHLRVSEIPGRIQATEEEEVWAADSPEELQASLRKLIEKLPAIDSLVSLR